MNQFQINEILIFYLVLIGIFTILLFIIDIFSSNNKQKKYRRNRRAYRYIE